jgi:hypothetical protein
VIERGVDPTLVGEQMATGGKRAPIAPGVAVVVDADDEAVSDFHAPKRMATTIPWTSSTKEGLIYAMTGMESQNLRTTRMSWYEKSAWAYKETRPGERAWAAENVA